MCCQLDPILARMEVLAKREMPGFRALPVYITVVRLRESEAGSGSRRVSTSVRCGDRQPLSANLGETRNE